MASAFPVCSTSVRNSPARATISLPATIAVSTSAPLAPVSSPTASTTGTIDAPEWARNVQSSHSSSCARKLFAIAAWRAEVVKRVRPITVASARSPNERTARASFTPGAIVEPA